MKIRFRPIIDGTPFQLNTSFDGNIKEEVKFYLNNLNKRQLGIIMDIIL
jgi:hypothetical protein